MKRKKIYSVILAILMVITFGQNANATEIAKNVFDIETSEFTLDKSPSLSYVVYGFTSLDNNAPEEFRDSSQYIEHYSIEFVYPDDSNIMNRQATNIVQSGTINLAESDTITIPAAKISKLGTKEIELPIMTNDMKKDILSLSETGIRSVLRNVSVNVFYANPEFSELDKINDGGNLNDETSSSMFVQKASVTNGAVTLNSRQDFPRMYASIYAYDEYSGGQKRQSFDAYHMKYNSQNKLTEGMAYINTFQFDTRPDVISLGWSLGGAIGMYDSSINLHCAYNLQCENCYLSGYSNIFGYNIFNRSSSDVSMHNTLFTGQAIGFNIPDIGITMCSNCGNGIRTRPAALNISAKSGWYNKGSYNGASGVVRSEYHHTYNSKTLTLNPSISIPFSISFSPSLVENKDFEKTWVYTTISPN